ncbi:S49 family peptidase [Paraburkholderia sp. SIMBA_030]|uniref:S49 family peptidase n=2 Tax=Pseudomonadati TaxID=3379134 RepID=UPI00397E627B
MARFPYLKDLLTHGGGDRSTRAPQATAATARPTRAASGAVAILPFHGIAVQRTDAIGEILGLVSIDRFTQNFRAAMADDSIGGVVIDIDSSGGSAYGIGELADEIYRARARKPIAAVANSLAASGAYWIASSASEVYSTPGGEVGSIGVFAAHQDFSKALDKAGLKPTLIWKGKYKVERSPFAPLGDAARHHLQTMVDECYGAFTRAVARNRGVEVAKVREGMGEGRTLSAQAAKAENMVDGVATLDEVVRKLAKQVGQGKPAAPPSRAAVSRTGSRIDGYQRVIDMFNT